MPATDDRPRCGRPKANGKPCGRRQSPCREHTTPEEQRAALDRAVAEMRRQDDAADEWLGAATAGRPTFVETEESNHRVTRDRTA